MRLQKTSLFIAICFLSINVYPSSEESLEFAFVSGEYQDYTEGYPAQASLSHPQAEVKKVKARHSAKTKHPHRGPKTSVKKTYYPAMPSQISAPGEKVILVKPRIHAWGAYSAKGKLLRSGRATSGGKWCADIGRSCKTSAGTFRIKSLGNESCKSRIYPVKVGGAPMPYCMFFNGGQGLHGSNQVVAANVSHGCVRLHKADARWIRYHFANIGTKVIIHPY